ncbi:MAG: starch-binding protein [Bacteroidaceae bacterium]|nr:starch-binding protein [Bacteroidaceae bacterium]
MKKILLTLVSALLLCANFNAMAWNLTANAKIYFDGTGWTNPCVQVMIGHDSWSQGYPMTKITNTNLYYRNMDAWGGYGYYAIFGTDGEWGGEGSSINNRKNWAPRSTGVANAELSNTYNLITSTGSTNISNEKISNYTALNHSQNITIEGNGSTSITAPYLTSVNGTTTTVGTTYVAAVYTSTVTCTATPDDGAEFLGWYDAEDNQVSTALTYTYTAPHADVNLTAKFSEVAVIVPTITSFTAEPAEITLGESVTLTSTTENTTNEVVYTVNEEVITSPWTPDAVGTYTITASLEGAVSKTATVTVNAVPVPALVSFTVTPSTIVLGESVTFTCEVEDADAADVEYTIDGNKITSPWTPGAVGTYEITATLAGAAETKTATVTVTAAPEEYTWTFYYIGGKTNVKTWVWDKGNNNKNYTGGVWPGQAMTDNNGTWEFTFTTTDVLIEPMVIFSGDQGQTGDLVLQNGAYYNDTEVVDPSQVHTVYFINNEGWGTVNVYAWNQETNENYLGDWPGSAATFVGDNVWKYNYYGDDINGAGLIFNNGSGGEGNQSYDLTWKDDAYYQYEGEVNKPVEEEAGFYFVTGTNDNWNECLAMTSTDGNIYTYTGPLKGGFKFRLYKESDNGQYGANSDNDLQIEIGKTYGMKSTSSNDAKTFTTPNGNPIKVTVEVNRALNTVRVLPADVYIAGSAVVEKYEASDVGGGSTGWGVSTIQGCDVDLASGTYTWTGYLYDDNGDGTDNSRFKFLLGSGFANGGHLIPDVATTDINYEEAYNLSFSWDDTSDRLFHSNGFDGMETYDGAAVEGETRVKVKAVIDLKNMTVTFYPVEEETFEYIFIAGNATEYGVDGRGALEPTTGENGEAVYTAVVNFVSADEGFLFPTTESALHPAFVAREDGKVAEHFALQGLDYSFASAPVDNQFKVESAGVYKVEVRPDFNSLYVLPYESTSPADGTYLTVEEKTQTETMTVTFFEKVSDFDASKVIITPETWWMHYNGVHIQGERQVLNKGISGGTVSFGVNSWDGCLTTGETYTITFEQGAVTFAAKGLTSRVNPKFSFTVTLAPDLTIGTGIEGVTVENGIAYKNGIVTAEGSIVVFNMSGAIVARGENEVDLNGMNGGVYIVRCGNAVSKVVR